METADLRPQLLHILTDYKIFKHFLKTYLFFFFFTGRSIKPCVTNVGNIPERTQSVYSLQKILAMSNSEPFMPAYLAQSLGYHSA